MILEPFDLYLWIDVLAGTPGNGKNGHEPLEMDAWVRELDAVGRNEPGRFPRSTRSSSRELSHRPRALSARDLGLRAPASWAPAQGRAAPPALDQAGGLKPERPQRGAKKNGRTRQPSWCGGFGIPHVVVFLCFPFFFFFFSNGCSLFQGRPEGNIGGFGKLGWRSPKMGKSISQ